MAIHKNTKTLNKNSGTLQATSQKQNKKKHIDNWFDWKSITKHYNTLIIVDWNNVISTLCVRLTDM